MVPSSRRRFLWHGLAAAGFIVTAACGLVPPWQATRKVYRVAWFTGSASNPVDQARAAVSRQSLQDLGYVEGQNLTTYERHAGGNDRLAEPAAELVRQQPDVILVPSTAVARALQAESMT